MNVRQALREAIDRLTAAGVPSAPVTAEVLLMHVLRRDRAFLHAHPETELLPDEVRAYRNLVGERAAGTPTQYLTRRQEFWGLSFCVEPGVFIPRPETEHVVEVALRLVRERLQRDDPRIVDVGTGSGCLALALASELPAAEVVATEISDKALAVARRNAEELGLAGRVQFVRSHLLDSFLGHHGAAAADFDNRAFDLIVSNPPYVGAGQAERLPREVREHEPPEALYAPEEGLEVTRRLVEQARAALVGSGPRAGWLVLELGHEMAGRVRALFGDLWTNIEITNDLQGIPRVLAAQKK